MQIFQRPKGINAPTIRPTQIILHSLGNGYNFDGGVRWLLDGALESHFAIRKDGLIDQLMPTNKRAQANYKANLRADGTGAISIETDSSIEAYEPWSDDQVQSIVELCTKLCLEYGIPPRICRSPTDPGIGWHIMWGTPGEWTPVAKACPGPARIKQVPGIVARVAAALVGNLGASRPAPIPDPQTPAPLPVEDTLSAAEVQQIKDHMDKLMLAPGLGGATWSETLNNGIAGVAREVKAIDSVLKVPGQPFYFPEATHNAVGVLIGMVGAQSMAAGQIDVAELANQIKDHLAPDVAAELGRRLAS